MNERLKKLRKTLDLTQQEFADRLGISRGNIGSYEVGKSALSDAVISLICREFNVNEDWLRTGEGEMFIQMTRDEEIAAFVAKALRTEEDSFKKRFIAMLSALDESDWESLEKIALLLVDKKEQDKPTP
ncbi:helix-turn-helix transcriptional regulator [Coprococcus sp. CLA-AA-H190]|uniref:Helix-turn-helix transcriptional regulator n=1 Tax=Coprococcus intestinihominis TaxID=3133154 RepID=A0ABV1B0E7_9FIRM